MTIQREMFLQEYRIAVKNKNYAFVDWLADQIHKFDKEHQITEAKLNKMAEISFLMGDVSIPHQILEKAYNELRMEVM
jgi:hypothetical protein